MKVDYAYLEGQIAEWPSRRAMIRLLKNAGLNVYVGQYSIRIEDFSHFVFQNYGGDICEPTIDADADSIEEMKREAAIVSQALISAEIKHRFEIYHVSSEQAVAYLHHDWPLDE
jgi:hypothetical protein